MKKLVNLKSVLFKEGKSMKKLSKETGIPLAYLSMACNGRMVLTDEEKLTIANSLKKSVDELFA
jgi:hypothetical protein